MLRLRTLVCLVMAAVSLPTAAGDLGVHGKVWPILEIDFRESLVRDAANVDWSAAQRELRDNVDTWLESRPAHDFPRASESKTVWLDLTYTLDKNMDIPVFDEKTGSYAWQTLYPKGTQVNPLDHQRPHDALVFFDARDPEQVRMAQRLSAAQPYRWMLIQTAGNPAHTSELFGRPVFHYQPALGERFQLSRVPAVVFAGNDAHSKHYGVAYLAAPYSDDDLSRLTELAFPSVAMTGSPQ